MDENETELGEEDETGFTLGSEDETVFCDTNIGLPAI